MKKPRLEWDREAAPVYPFGYVTASWRLGEGWQRIASTGAAPEPATASWALEQHAAVVEQVCRLVGVMGLNVLLAPARPAPAYWLEATAGINAPTSKLHGCAEDGADVIICEVVGIASRACTGPVEERLRGLLVAVHASLAEVLP